MDNYRGQLILSNSKFIRQLNAMSSFSEHVHKPHPKQKLKI